MDQREHNTNFLEPFVGLGKNDYLLSALSYRRYPQIFMLIRYVIFSQTVLKNLDDEQLKKT